MPFPGRSTFLAFAVGCLTFVVVRAGSATTWTCAGGDSACLIAAMTAANAAPGTYADHTIILGTGSFVFTTPHPSAPAGDTALPLVTGGMTIRGAGGLATKISRPMVGPSAAMRLFDVAHGGTLVLADLTVQRGIASTGGGVRNHGTLAIYRTTLRWNTAPGQEGGGLWSDGLLGITSGLIYSNQAFGGSGGGINIAGGSATILDSLISWNGAGAAGAGGGGIAVETGALTLQRSSIVQNRAGSPGGGIANGPLFTSGGTALISDSFIGFNHGDAGSGIVNRGLMELVNTTMEGNTMGSEPSITAIDNFGGTLIILQSTIAHNPQPDGAILRNVDGVTNESGGLVLIQNSVLTGSQVPDRPGGRDCVGAVMSLGNNILNDPAGCDIALQPSDRTGNPGLGPLVDTGLPGRVYFPLLPTSKAIAAANPSICPQRDQIGQPRDVVCDIGAIERVQGLGGVAQR